MPKRSAVTAKGPASSRTSVVTTKEEPQMVMVATRATTARRRPPFPTAPGVLSGRPFRVGPSVPPTRTPDTLFTRVRGRLVPGSLYPRRRIVAGSSPHARLPATVSPRYRPQNVGRRIRLRDPAWVRVDRLPDTP